MDTIEIVDKIDQYRRRLFSTAAMTLAATQLGMAGSARAQSKTKPTDLPKIKPGTHTSFAPLKQIDAGALNVGYAEAAEGRTIL
jgi:hypothetical protein